MSTVRYSPRSDDRSLACRRCANECAVRTPGGMGRDAVRRRAHCLLRRAARDRQPARLPHRATAPGRRAAAQRVRPAPRRALEGMPRLVVGQSVGRAEAERIRSPRHDIVDERADGEGRFVLAHGPFARYERTVTVTPQHIDGDGRGRGHGADPAAPLTVTQRFDYRLPPGTWPFLMNHPIRGALRRPRTDGRLPWWYPPQRPDARAATVLGLLATLSLVVGYHGTLLTQTMSFAADEFGADTTAQGAALGAVRVGGLLAILLGALADRRGRRLLLNASLLGCIAATVAGAVAPNLAVLTATQVVNRGTVSAAGVLLAIVAVEEMPAGARAYALSLLSMTGALGAGMALWVLPVADVGLRAWRLMYLVPLLFLPVVLRFGRLVPESRRYERP